jgi:hypothetical protein
MKVSTKLVSVQASTGTTFIDGADPGVVTVPEDNATEIFDFLPAFIKAATNK